MTNSLITNKIFYDKLKKYQNSEKDVKEDNTIEPIIEGQSKNHTLLVIVAIIVIAVILILTFIMINKKRKKDLLA